MASTEPQNDSTIESIAPTIEISEPKVTIEVVLGRGRNESTGTKVLSVAWDVTTVDTTALNGEWVIEWDNMYASDGEDLRSAKSEKGTYFALQRGANTPGGGTPVHEIPEPVYHPAPDYTNGAPLSTAKLLAFENGLDDFEETEDLVGFFSSRPIVQAPTQIIPDPESKRATVHFLLTGNALIPDAIHILFVPTWGTPLTLATVPTPSRTNYQSGGKRNLHSAWAEARMDDLATLEEIARELELEGARGVGTGNLKVGVEGGGMDEEAVRREGWMVGEEMIWVRETFLNKHIAEEEPGPSNDTGLGLNINTNSGSKAPLKLSTTVSPGGTVYKSASSTNHLRTTAIAQEEEDDLFALPLSPRSPEMSVSPFSMFRGEAVGKQPMSRLNQVVSIDTSLSPSVSVGGSKDNTPTGLNSITPTMGRLKIGGYEPLTPPIDRVGVGKE